MQKVYQNELGPEPIPFTVPLHAIDDEDVIKYRLFHVFGIYLALCQ